MMKILNKFANWVSTEFASGRLFFALGLLMMVAPSFADSTDLKSVVATLSSNIKGITDLLLTISQVAGIGFAAAGIVKFKQHKDMPHQVTLSQCIVLFAIGVGLVALPQLAKIFGTSAGLNVDIKSSDSIGQ